VGPGGTVKGDLHIHTDVSDGALSPSKVALEAAGAGLGFLAITDHNSVAGIGAMRQALVGHSPELVCGVELTSQPDDGEEVHLLGYGFDPECPALCELCREICRLKKQQLRHIILRLRATGLAVDSTVFQADGDDSYAGRPALAQMLLRRGIVSSLGQAFARYLGSNGSAFVAMARMEPGRCIDTIHQAGGVSVLAHPRIQTIDRWLADLVAAGLDGIEVFRPGLRGNLQLYAEKAAEHFGLFMTGGSDWHGRQGDAPLGAFCVSREQLAGFFSAIEAA